MQSQWCWLALCLAACGGGGGGGGGPTPPVGTKVTLTAPAVRIASGAPEAVMEVKLAEQAETATALLQVDVTLPPELTLPPKDRLQQTTSVVRLDGDFTAGAFRVMVGDDTNVNAQALQAGELFGLVLVPSAPRQPGTYQVILQNMLAATSNGEAVAVSSDPVVVSVVIE